MLNALIAGDVKMTLKEYRDWLLKRKKESQNNRRECQNLKQEDLEKNFSGMCISFDEALEKLKEVEGA